MPYNNIVVIGGGAIGGITAALLTKKGENVIVLDADREHVNLMNKGLEVSGFTELTIPVKSLTPDQFTIKEYAGWADIVLLAVKGLHTEKALSAILPCVAKTAPGICLFILHL